MRRAFVYVDKDEKDGKVLVVEDSIETFKNEIKKHFCVTDHEDIDIYLYLENDCEIHDTRVIMNNEKVYLTRSRENVEKLTSALSKKCTLAEDKNSAASRYWITLNVGGKHFTMSRSTLLAKEPQSMLARMFSDDTNVLMTPSATDSAGAYLIDRSPRYFEPILNYLRHGEVILDANVNPRGVLEEAVFYGIDSMIPQLNQLIEEWKQNSVTNHPLTRMDVIRSIITTSNSSKLRFQGVNLAGADLSRLDLQCINFKYACLSKCNLSGANLSHCCLERADLSHANLEGAQLLGVKALCANMEGANLKGCNMEDPAGSRAVFESVNLKGANLEGSNMAGVNLRVATLKNANLQNCDLRTAVLAGADLEWCDLSGSDLHEANLRGANLKDAAFALMLTPLHMSQTIR